LEKVIQLDSQDAQAHNDLGLIYQKLENYHKAKENFDLAIRLDK